MTLEADGLGLHCDLFARSLQDPQPSVSGASLITGGLLSGCLEGFEGHFPPAVWGMMLDGAVTGFYSINHGMRRLVPFQTTLSPFDHRKEKSSVDGGRYYPSITG